MNDEIPYRAAGTFVGPSYVKRDADATLLTAVQQNRRYPYIVAPRQSGKSSLLLRIRRLLDPVVYRTAFVDLSTLDITEYEVLWLGILTEVAHSAGLPTDVITSRHPEDTIHAWLTSSRKRLVVFLDEIDTLLGASFRDQFFGKLRSLFNKRAEDQTFAELTVVLAGAAHPSQLITDQVRSPFNVGIEITLADLTLSQVQELVSHIDRSGAEVDSRVPERVHAVTGGSVYLGQLLMERLWEIGTQTKSIKVKDVDNAVAFIIKDAPHEIHFQNIYQIISQSERLSVALDALRVGLSLDERTGQELRIAGISDGVTPYRNLIYRKVFGADGPLALQSRRDVENLVEDQEALASNAPARDATEQSAPSQGRIATPPSIATAQSVLSARGRVWASGSSLGAFSDEDLVRIYLDGDGSAVGVLVKRYYDRIRAFFNQKIARPIDGADAEDLTQRVFISVLSALQKTKDRQSFRGLLYTTAHHLLFATFRLERRRGHWLNDDELEDLEDFDFDLNSWLARRTLLAQVAYLLPALPATNQMMLKLIYWDGLMVHEVASQLGLSAGGVKTKLRSIREQLKRRVEEEGHLFDTENVDVADWVIRVNELIRNREG